MNSAALHFEVRTELGRPAIGAGPIVDEVEALLTSGYPPGLALAVVDRRGALVTAIGGAACVVGEVVRLSDGTLFDLASLTKVVATVPLALVLAQRGRWRLEDPVVRWLEEFPRGDTTIRNLLTHTAGLVDHRPFYLTCQGGTAIRKAVCEAAQDAQPGREVCYSDLSFMLLGWAIERCAGTRLDELFTQEIAAPLGMGRARFRPPARLRRQTAATELDGDQRPGGGLIWGAVHDGNAFALGGIAGHAGLFAPLGDLVTFSRALLEPAHHPVLSEASIAAMSSVQAGRAPDVRGLGWRLEPKGWGSWPSGTYWHTGFTGTSVLVSPRRGLAVVLLMNGVHPVRRPEEQQAIRARLHTIVEKVCR